MRFSNQFLTNLIYRITQSKWLIIAFIIGFILLLLPTPPGLTLPGYRTIIIVIIALTLIITEPISLPGVAFIIIVLQVYFGIGDANLIARSFMNDAVFFIMGSLMLAVAIIKQGLDARIALGIIRLTGNRTRRIAFGFTALSAILASFIGGPTVAAIMLPIGMTLIKNTTADSKKAVNLSGLLLFSIAYGSLVGSIGTPSGGGRNAIMLIYWNEFGAPALTYADWMLYVYPLVLIQIPVLGWILWKSFTPEFLQLDSGVRKLKVQVAKAGKVHFSEILAVAIFFLVFLGWIFLSERFGLGIIALSGVVLYLVTGLVKWRDLDRHVNWGVIILFGATISLGTQIKTTGAAVWLANQILDMLGQSLYSISLVTDTVIVTLTTVLANVFSSSATVAVLAPITLNLPGDTIHVGLLTVISSAFGYFTAVAAPACTIIYASGLLKAKDFLKTGWKMGVASIILVMIYANTYWPLLK